ncbi:MAG: IgGFc-binding protein [Deltaproteobacteria bacterium]|nr:IgGFc-binding protein [Deltaproteobacteria bacterium]
MKARIFIGQHSIAGRGRRSIFVPLRMSVITTVLLALSALFALSECKAKAPNNNTSNGDGSTQDCNPGEIHCEGTTAKTCDDTGHWGEGEKCPSACVDGKGCVACVEGRKYCLDNQIAICDENQQLQVVSPCDETTVCIVGECVSKCDPRVLTASNVGCHFFAVDLDNEAYDMGGTSNDAAAEQYAVAVANVNDYPVQVTIYKNTAPFGSAISEQVVAQEMVAPMSLKEFDLPQREVDGCMGQNGSYVMGSGSGTFVSSHAYRIESNGPVIAYQFNPIIQKFSNDASILIPTQALGKNHIVMGWPTANPCGAPEGDPMHMDSIPDHTSVTIVGAEPDTHVTVTPTHPVMASGGDSGLDIPETQKGQDITFTIGPYDVVNLESLQFVGSITECMSHTDQNGDFTGTVVTSDKPVAVFSSLERGIGFGGAKPPDPPDWDGETCCTDHLEQQMFPVTAWGWKFVVTRSPVRSTDSNWREPDIYRILASEPNTVATTTLDDFPSFTLNAGEWATFYADHGFTVEVQGGAIMLGQILVSQGFIPQGGIGDPTFVVFPPAEQHRLSYVFLIPTTFEKNYMVLAMPAAADVHIDGHTIGEFNTTCETETIGTLNNTLYSQLTCLMDEGVHKVESNVPVGLSVYGYYNVGSYGYPGGSDIKEINPVK